MELDSWEPWPPESLVPDFGLRDLRPDTEEFGDKGPEALDLLLKTEALPAEALPASMLPLLAEGSHFRANVTAWPLSGTTRKFQITNNKRKMSRRLCKRVPRYIILDIFTTVHNLYEHVMNESQKLLHFKMSLPRMFLSFVFSWCNGYFLEVDLVLHILLLSSSFLYLLKWSLSNPFYPIVLLS